MVTERKKSGRRDGNHKERGVPVTDIPCQVPPARGILKEDEVPRPQLTDFPVSCLHLYRTRHEGEELPGGARVPVADPAGLECIEAVLRRRVVRASA